MLRFQTVITTKDYFDQTAEGFRLNNEIVTGITADDKENVVVRKQYLTLDEVTKFTTNISNYIGSVSLLDVQSVHMFCNYPKQYKDSDAIGVSCRVTLGMKILGSVSQFTMYGLDGLTEEITFSNITPPNDLPEDALIQFIIFINLKN